MFKMHLFLVLCLSVLISGCSPMPAEITLNSKAHSAENAGLIVGALIEGGPYGTWIEFRDVNTAKTYGWGAKNYYSAWLPAGVYEVSRLGSRSGVMAAYTKPLRINVKQGYINYLGEMAYDCPLLAQPEALYGVMSCGLLALGSCSVPSPSVGICIVDRQELTIILFLIRHPEYAQMNVHSSVLSAR
jgi:hypothetical protein